MNPKTRNEPAHLKLCVAALPRIRALQPSQLFVLLHVAALAASAPDGVADLTRRSKRALADELGATLGTIDNALSALCRAGLLSREGAGSYRPDATAFLK